MMVELHFWSLSAVVLHLGYATILFSYKTAVLNKNLTYPEW